jgi:predicted metal-dependent hydrolase
MQPPKKHQRMEEFVRNLGSDPELSLDPCYQGYFTCFNSQRYYEAHDVLEHLWLQGDPENYAFFKGLIQFAGAFVHLKKQREFPEHPKHGRRLRPAVRLFDLAASNLSDYRPRHMDLDVTGVCALCEQMAQEIIAGRFKVNPWKPQTAPQIRLG